MDEEEIQVNPLYLFPIHKGNQSLCTDVAEAAAKTITPSARRMSTGHPPLEAMSASGVRIPTPNPTQITDA